VVRSQLAIHQLLERQKMSTHGHVVFYEMNGKRPIRPINCYTWHDGHREEAVADLLNLPFKIFSKQKDAYIRANSTDLSRRDISGLAEGYWVYDQNMKFKLREAKNNLCNREDIYNDWLATIPLQTCSLAYATWFCQNRFNRWNVVPSVKWCTYPGPDVKIYCTSSRINSYTIEIVFSEEDKDYADESEIEYLEKITELNSLIPNQFFTFKNASSINCHYQLFRKENTIQIVVPFDSIWCELFWKDVEILKGS